MKIMSDFVYSQKQNGVDKSYIVLPTSAPSADKFTNFDNTKASLDTEPIGIGRQRTKRIDQKIGEISFLILKILGEKPGIFQNIKGVY